jgi:hypothetical protein
VDGASKKKIEMRPWSYDRSDTVREQQQVPYVTCAIGERMTRRDYHYLLVAANGK